MSARVWVVSAIRSHSTRDLGGGVVCLVRITLCLKFQLVLACFTGNWVCFGQLVRYNTEQRARVKLETLLELFEWCVAWTIKVPRRSSESDKGPVGLERHSCIGYYYLYTQAYEGR